MEVEFRLTPDDLTAFRRWHQKHPPFPSQRASDPNHWLLWIIVFVGVAALLFLRDVLHDPSFDNVLNVLPGVGAGIAIGFFGIIFYSKLMTGAARRRMLEQGRNAEKVLGWRRISIDERAIRVETEYSFLTYQWGGVDAITASPDHAFIYFATNNAFILPREAFRTDRDFEEFVEAARRYRQMARVVEREGTGEIDRRERPRFPDVLPAARPGGPTTDEGITARTPPETPGEGKP